ncbi:MAG: hypothetical protein Q4B54_12170 [Coriobacteriales bacterium]|nr:hypothetical protein [Coriobacteriales bacterium]
MKRNAWIKTGATAPFALGTAFVLAMDLYACVPVPVTSQSSVENVEEQQITSDEDVIRQGIAAEMDELIHPTQEKLADHLATSDAELLEFFVQYGLNYQELIEHFLGRMTYHIDEVTVDQDHARVALTITNVNIDEALGELEASLNSPEGMEEFKAGYDAKDDAALMQAVMRRAFECIDAYQDQVSTSVELTLTKTDNSWRVDESSMQAFVNAVYAGFDFAALDITAV